MKNRIVCALAFTVVSGIANAVPLQPERYGDFDRYVLALSWQTGFCQSVSDRRHGMPAECRIQKETADKTQNLTVHGLWPGLPGTIAARGVDAKRWTRFGCATRPEPNMPETRASRKCAAPSTGMSSNIASQLTQAMPGAGGSSCLERYEFAKHGACFGFNPDAYFGTMVRLNQEVRQSALGQFLAHHYGEVVSRNDFNETLNQQWGKNSVKAVKLTCQGNPAYLTEIQITLKAADINAPLNNTSFFAQPHPGNCPKTFRLDAAGY